VKSTNEQIYGNCQVLHPDGTLMFRCTAKRAKWYLDRNLAVIVDATDTDRLIIQLTFIPNGKGHADEEFYTLAKKNQCVVCGSESALTKHHVVPICYRRHFSDNIKSRDSHDIIPVCWPCHEAYEKHAREFKNELAIQHGESMGVAIDLKLAKARSYAASLLRHRSIIPPDRQIFLTKTIAEYLGKDSISEEDILCVANIVEKKTATVQAKVAKKIENISDFCKMWRKHFVSIMKPQFLPDRWDINYERKR